MKGLFWKILFRSIRLRLDKWSLMTGSLGIGVSVAVAVSSLTLDLEKKMNKELRAYGPNLVLRPSQGNGSGGATLPEELLGEVKRLADGHFVAGTSFLYRLGDVRGQTSEKVVLVGTDTEALAPLYPFWRLQSGARSRSLRPDECFVGKKLADRLPIRSGERVTVTVQGRKLGLRVVDILTTGEIEESQLLLPLKSLQELSGERGVVSVVAVSLLGRFEEILSFVDRLKEVLPNTEVRLMRKVAVEEGEVLNKLKLMMTLSALALLVITTLSVGTILSAIVLERRGEVALLKALGLPDRLVLRLFLSEAFFLGVVGGGIGYGIGLMMSQVLGKTLFGSLIAPSWQVLPAAFFLALVTSLISFMAPVKRTLALDPATVLKE